MPKVILHAGLHKTASTSIQETLRHNIDRLRADGFCVCGQLSPNQSSFFKAAFAENPEKYHFFQKKGQHFNQIRKHARSQIKRVLNEVRADEYQTVVFSAEDSSTLTETELQDTRNFLGNIAGPQGEIQVIVYVRDPIDYLRSAAQQHVQTHYVTLRAAIDRLIASGIKYARRIENMCTVFGRQNVSVFAYEDAIAFQPLGIVGHFLCHIGFAAGAAQELKTLRANKAISEEALSLISFMNSISEIEISERERRWMRKLKSIGGQQARNFLLHNDLDRAVESWRDDYDYLNTIHGIEYHSKVGPPGSRSELKTLWGGQPVMDLMSLWPEFSQTVRAGIEQYFERMIQISAEDADQEALDIFNQIRSQLPPM